MADVRYLSNLKFPDFLKGIRRGGYSTAGRAQANATSHEDPAAAWHGIGTSMVFNACGGITTPDGVWGELWRLHQPLAGVTLECRSPTASPKAPSQARVAAAADRYGEPLIHGSRDDAHRSIWPSGRVTKFVIGLVSALRIARANPRVSRTRFVAPMGVTAVRFSLNSST